MSKKVNNLRKRIRQLEQQNAKELRDIAQRKAALEQREAALAKREADFARKPKVDDATVAIVMRRHGEYYRRPGKIYAFQLVVDFDDLRYRIFKDQRDIRESYALLGWIEGQLINELKKLYDDVLRAEYPEMRQVRREA
jgi:hypothetical protein